jgi:Ca2+/Na+ antiporter
MLRLSNFIKHVPPTKTNLNTPLRCAQRLVQSLWSINENQMNTKKKNLFISKPILFIGLGILIIGFIYDIIFINIPPQDAPDYLIKERNELYKKLSIIYNTAYIALAISLF